MIEPCLAPGVSTLSLLFNGFNGDFSCISAGGRSNGRTTETTRLALSSTSILWLSVLGQDPAGDTAFRVSLPTETACGVILFVLDPRNGVRDASPRFGGADKCVLVSTGNPSGYLQFLSPHAHISPSQLCADHQVERKSNDFPSRLRKISAALRPSAELPDCCSCSAGVIERGIPAPQALHSA